MDIDMPNIASVTKRQAVVLPQMPDEHEANRRYPAFEMTHARFQGHTLHFNEVSGFDRALSDGFFLLEIPDEVPLDGGDRFVRHFFEARAGGGLADYTGYRERIVPGDYQGYFDREHDQWENFYIERSNWGMLPAPVIHTGEAMSRVGIDILRATLDHIGIPKSEWHTLTGGLTADRGHQMLAFNHFRSDKRVRGSKFHRDSGWVTVLRSTEPGLLAYIDGELCAINPKPGYFIVNFGSSIEVLTERLPKPVRANIHGVAQTMPRRCGLERVSYVVFLDSDLQGDIYQYRGDAHVRVQSVKDFAIQEVSRTYDGAEYQL
jgi:hypothetical protein